MDDYLKGATFSLGRFRVACGDKLLEVVLEYRKVNFCKRYTLKFRKYAPGPIFSKGPFIGGAYIRREISVSKSAKLILGGNMRLKIHWASL